MIGPIKVNKKHMESYIRDGYWTKKTILDYWNEAVSRYRDKVYVIDDKGMRLTYGEVDSMASCLAKYFIAIGIQTGEVVTFQIPVWAEFVIVAMACFKIGAILHPLAMFYEKCDLIRSMNKTKSRIYIGPTFFYKTDYEKQICEIHNRVPNLEHLIFLDNQKPVEGAFITLKKIIQEMPSLETTLERNFDGFDICLILSTSGTTGGSKGVLFTHNTILYAERTFNRELGLSGNDRMFMASPLNHATGFHHGIISPMLLGASVVLQQKFHAKEAIELMNRENCTYSMGATPFIYDIQKIIKEEKTKLTTLKLYLCGGAPVPKYIVQDTYSIGLTVCEVYGSTESVPHIFVRPDEALENAGCTSGRPISGVEVKVVDENRYEVPTLVCGEEASRGPNMFVGYLDDIEATDRVLDDDGWFYSGDLCIKDNRGNIKIIGRKKDMIVRGGENLDANEIDTYIEGCPGIVDHTVVGMPDERLGERICAYIVLDKEYAFLQLDRLEKYQYLIEYLKRKQVPKRFWPERVESIKEIPRTHSGKVKKHILIEKIKYLLEVEKRGE